MVSTAGFLVESHTQTRQIVEKDFAKKYVYKDQSWWNDVISADESKFNLHGSDGRKMVWRKVNEELKIKTLKPTVKHGGGNVIVWGCISTVGVGEPVFLLTVLWTKISIWTF